MYRRRRIAMVELGTRGIRLLVADVDNNKIVRTVRSTGDLSNLGKEVDNQGNLSMSSIRRVTQITKHYKKMADEANADAFFIIATEVVRKAPNQEQLREALSDIAPIDVLTGKEEAMCIFIASTSSFANRIADDQPLLVVDQGGGSTELVFGYIRNGVRYIEEIAQYPLGTASLSRVFLSEPFLSRGFKKVYQYVQHVLHEPIIEPIKPRIAIAHGSSIMVFATEIVRQEQGYSPKLREMHGYSVKPRLMKRKIEEMLPSLRNRKQSDYGDELSVDSELVTLMSGISTYYRIAQLYQVRNYVLSREGLRFGALLWKSGVVCHFVNKDDGIPSSTDADWESVKYLHKKVNLNSASAEEIATLQNIGPVLANRIVKKRNTHGPYKSLDDLSTIQGISPATVSQLASYVTI